MFTQRASKMLSSYLYD
ncbi:hypothetical protein [Escherichia fergusonii]